MYLKKIETQGFKSFANKAVMEFTPGIMGIVGPNGSGKSNVADAVRWVLGEQSSRQLRGSNMQDVIFAGTENRRPMSYAYVSLTIDNSDHVLPVEYDEVTVMRQVFRSGESEYRLNGNLCRLRDIYELFYDSGIGKEGYSIIGQGQIDLVLSNKPEERRQMFDEAAGIVKYKKRKDITLKKLEAEQQSLTRIQDILGELEKQVGPLEKQSARARTYLKLREELKTYEVGAFALESDELEKKLAATKNNLDMLEGDLQKTRDEAEQLRIHYDSLSEQNEALDKELAEARARLADLRVAQETREGRIQVLTEQIHATENQQDVVADRIRVLDENLARLGEERDDYYKQKNDINRQQDLCDDKITRAEGEAEILDDKLRELQFTIDRDNAELLAALNRREKLSRELAAAESKKEQLELRLAGLSEGKEKEAAELAEAEAQCEALTAALSGLKEEEEKLQQTLQELKSEREEAAGALSAARSEQHRLENDWSVAKSRVETLENLIERYSGYGGSVKSVLEQKDRCPGIRGAVADLIRSDKKYETAIETALGSRLQNVVTDTESTAKSLIEYLKKEKLGRVTFLPLDAVKGGRSLSRPEALREPGAIGTAQSLVRAEDDLQGVINFLLGSILVADRMDHALAIARKNDYRLSIVTLDGESLMPGGAIAGGSFKNNSNLLGRRRELSEQEAIVAESARNISRLKKEIAGFEKTLSLSQNRYEESDRSLRTVLLRSSALEAQNKAAGAERARLVDAIKAREAEILSLEQELEELRFVREQLSENTGQLTDSQDSRREELNKALGLLEVERGKLAEKNRQLEEMRLEFAALTQKNDFLLEQIRRIAQEISRTENEKDQLTKGEFSVTDVIREKEEEILRLQAEILDDKEEIAGIEKQLEENDAIREKGREQQQGFFESREEISGRISALDKESFRLQSQQQRLEEQIERQAEYLWTEYEMTPSQARAVRNPELKSASEVHRVINQKKREIKELGPVYVDAIEKYKEVSERYEFLKAQESDLVTAETQLRAMISDLDGDMRTRFREQFSLVQAEFAKVFSELFAGGKGSLELEPHEDILTAGVIINAQPPGKKLQNMMQLSGGEKALTAIALLFAIQNLKPSPFCLLDEIEAALDEPNVKRFGDYLYKLRNTTQFLIITHRRGTMEMADRLYGITMQEKGVSALVSVNLRDPADKALLDEQD